VQLTLWVITVLLHVTIYLDKLLENCSIAAGALIGKSSAVMKVTVY
jgi:hypothetical protein